MLNHILLFFVVLVATMKSDALNPPKDIVLCHRSDPDYAKCLRQAIQHAINSKSSDLKKLGIPNINYMKIPSVNIEGNGGTIDLSQHYTDCVVTGATEGIVTYAEAVIKKEDCYIRYSVFTEITEMVSKYIITGKLMLFEISGHGNSNITLVNTVWWHNLTCNIYEKNGNEYLNITKWVEHDIPEKVMFDFENVVDGNPKLSAQILQIVNDNWVDVYINLIKDYEQAFATIFKQAANNVFSKIPWKDIFLE